MGHSFSSKSWMSWSWNYSRNIMIWEPLKLGINTHLTIYSLFHWNVEVRESRKFWCGCWRFEKLHLKYTVESLLISHLKLKFYNQTSFCKLTQVFAGEMMIKHPKWNLILCFYNCCLEKVGDISIVIDIASKQCQICPLLN